MIRLRPPERTSPCIPKEYIVFLPLLIAETLPRIEWGFGIFEQPWEAFATRAFLVQAGIFLSFYVSCVVEISFVRLYMRLGKEFRLLPELCMESHAPALLSSSTWALWQIWARRFFLPCTRSSYGRIVSQLVRWCSTQHQGQKNSPEKVHFHLFPFSATA